MGQIVKRLEDNNWETIYEKVKNNGKWLQIEH